LPGVTPAPYSWPFDPDATVLVPAYAILYVLSFRLVRPERWRQVLYATGLLLLLIVFVTPIDTLALHYLLTVHLLQNVVVAEWAPALMVAGLAPLLAQRLVRFPGARVVLHPAFTLPAWALVYALWHLPPLYDLALRHTNTIIHLEHGSYFTVGMLLWWPLLQRAPHALSHGAKAIYALAAFVVASPLGLVLALLTSPIYSTYEHAPRLWGLSALADQQIAGMTMAVEQSIVLFVVFTYQLLRFLAEEEDRTA
jgi:putative membrane protein